MKEHFQKRVDDTRQAYLDALDRLKKNIPNHPDLKGKKFTINATSIALESGKTRNPLYNTHKDILEMIQEVKVENKSNIIQEKENSENISLKERIKILEEQNKKLMNVNAVLLFEKNKLMRNQ